MFGLKRNMASEHLPWTRTLNLAAHSSRVQASRGPGSIQDSDGPKPYVTYKYTLFGPWQRISSERAPRAHIADVGSHRSRLKDPRARIPYRTPTAQTIFYLQAVHLIRSMAFCLKPATVLQLFCPCALRCHGEPCSSRRQRSFSRA